MNPALVTAKSGPWNRSHRRLLAVGSRPSFVLGSDRSPSCGTNQQSFTENRLHLFVAACATMDLRISNKYYSHRVMNLSRKVRNRPTKKINKNSPGLRDECIRLGTQFSIGLFWLLFIWPCVYRFLTRMNISVILLNVFLLFSCALSLPFAATPITCAFRVLRHASSAYHNACFLSTYL